MNNKELEKVLKGLIKKGLVEVYMEAGTKKYKLTSMGTHIAALEQSRDTNKSN